MIRMFFIVNAASAAGGSAASPLANLHAEPEPESTTNICAMHGKCESISHLIASSCAMRSKAAGG